MGGGYRDHPPSCGPIVDYVPNFDETTTEPTVLPTPFPNLLVNGSTGIAVGMATNVPPHNLREVIEGVIWLIETTMMPVDPAAAPPSAVEGEQAAASTPQRLTKEQKLRGLVERIPGPDFPTGGLIVGRAARALGEASWDKGQSNARG